MEFINKYTPFPKDADQAYDWMVIRAGSVDPPSAFGEVRMIGAIYDKNGVEILGGGGGGGDSLDDSIIWRPGGVVAPKVIIGSAADVVTAISSSPQLKYIYIDDSISMPIIDTAIDLKNTIELIGFRSVAKAAGAQTTKVEIAAGGTLTDPSSLISLDIVGVGNTLPMILFSPLSTESRSINFKLCTFDSDIQNMAIFAAIINAPSEIILTIDTCRVTDRASPNSTFNSSGNGTIKIVVNDNSLFGGTSNTEFFNSPDTLFGVSGDTRAAFPLVNQSYTSNYGVDSANAVYMQISDNDNQVTPSSFVGYAKIPMSVSDNMRYLNLLNCFGYGSIKTNVGINSFPGAAKQEIDFSGGTLDIQNYGNVNNTPRVIAPFRIECNGTINALIEVVFDLKVQTNPGGVSISFTHEVDTMGTPSFGFAQQKLPLAGNNAIVSLKFFQKNWATGTNLGRFYMESTGNCVVAVGNAQVFARPLTLNAS